MPNIRMQEKLADGRCLDVEKVGYSVRSTDGVIDGTWCLNKFQDDVDYCVASTETWIWSIGQAESGAIYAATDNRFYQRAGFTCLWLR
jgi:hypothetical protein